MKRNLLCLLGLFLFLALPAFAQGESKSLQKNMAYKGQFESLSQENIPLISSFQFGGSFAVHLVSDDQSNFFLLNLSLLSDEFENKYFIKEVYKSQLFIQYGHGLPSDKAWIVTDNKMLPENVITSLINLLSNVKSVSATMSESDKNQWLLSQKK
jgi:hypothetical protein